MNFYHTATLFLAVTSIAACIHAQSRPALQDSILSSQLISASYFDQVSSRLTSLDQKLEKQISKALLQLQRQQTRLKKRLAKRNPVKASTVFTDANDQLQKLQDDSSHSSSLKQYIPSLDTLRCSFKFLQQHPQFLSTGKEVGAKMKLAVVKLNVVEERLRKAEIVKIFLKERKQYLKDPLSNLGFAKELKKINKQVYYYSAQLNEYKSLLKDHKKRERKALELLSKTKQFQIFMRRNSMLAFLFRLPGDHDETASPQVVLAGLQTRAQVNGLIQQQLSIGGSNTQLQMQQTLQSAQSKLAELKDKVGQLGFGNGDIEMPEGFKPNNQKSRTFLDRLELGANIQSQKANNYFPVTSDIGLTLGYKLNDHSVVGIGGSYKLGWGRDIRHINISHQGASLRSFLDFKIKGAFWLSGGYEMNYQTSFEDIDQLKDLDHWTKSGLIGVSKVISLKTKFFKKTKIQLLWDFLSYDQLPYTPPVVFRIGYTLN